MSAVEIHWCSLLMRQIRLLALRNGSIDQQAQASEGGYSSLTKLHLYQLGANPSEHAMEASCEGYKKHRGVERVWLQAH